MTVSLASSARRLRWFAALLALALTFAAVAPAYATKPSKSAAVAAARKVAASLARQTHASSYRVVGCRKSSSIHYVCQVENSFKSGAKRCTADVVVNFKGGRTRTSYSNYVCF
jgi:hypothetical protein